MPKYCTRRPITGNLQGLHYHRYLSLSLAILTILLCGACSENDAPPPIPQVDAASTEAREDSLALAAAYAGQDRVKASVTATTETTVAKASIDADAADDPAIWVNVDNPAGSLVFGSNKTGGMAVYNLDGEEIDYYPIGKINNIDIIDSVPFDGKFVTLLGCSNRTEQSINLFTVNESTGKLTNITEGPLFMDSLRIDDVYGFCFARADEGIYAIVNGKNGVLQQFLLSETNGLITSELVRDLTFPSQTEGMVADNAFGVLYVGEEAAGIHRLPIVPGKDELDGHRYTSLLNNRVGTPEDIVADVEGLTLYTGPRGRGFLIASIQGNFTYAIFDRANDNRYVGSFKVVDGIVDGVEETDGLDIISTALPGFPRGLLVLQDGFNYDGDELRPQNFKYVDAGAILDLQELDW